MNATKARAAVEDMAIHYGALSDAKEDCKAQVGARMEDQMADLFDEMGEYGRQRAYALADI